MPGEDTETETDSGSRQGEDVDRAGQQKQHGGQVGHPCRSPASFDQQHRTGGDAPGATERHGGAEREFAEGDPRAEPDRGAIEDLEEREHIGRTREDLQRDRQQDQAGGHRV